VNRRRRERVAKWLMVAAAGLFSLLFIFGGIAVLVHSFALSGGNAIALLVVSVILQVIGLMLASFTLDLTVD
jgi:hypothetical protein